MKNITLNKIQFSALWPDYIHKHDCLIIIPYVNNTSSEANSYGYVFLADKKLFPIFSLKYNTENLYLYQYELSKDNIIVKHYLLKNKIDLRIDRISVLWNLNEDIIEGYFNKVVKVKERKDEPEGVDWTKPFIYDDPIYANIWLNPD